MIVDHLCILLTFFPFVVIYASFDNLLQNKYQYTSRTGLLTDALPQAIQNHLVHSSSQEASFGSFPRVEDLEYCHMRDGPQNWSIQNALMYDRPVSTHYTGLTEDMFTKRSSPGDINQYFQYLGSMNSHQDGAHRNEQNFVNHNLILNSDTQNFEPLQDYIIPNNLPGCIPEYDPKVAGLWEPGSFEACQTTSNIYNLPEFTWMTSDETYGHEFLNPTNLHHPMEFKISGDYQAEEGNIFTPSFQIAADINKPQSEGEVSQRQGLPSKFKTLKYKTFSTAKYSQKVIQDNAHIFEDMSTFWAEIESRMEQSMTLFFPKSSVARNSISIWSAKNIMFPLFIHRVAWIYEHFHTGTNRSFPYPDLLSALYSAKNYFKGWMAEEVKYFCEGVLKGSQSEEDKLSLYKDRELVSEHLQSQVLYKLEFNRKDGFDLQSIPWKILKEWTSKHVNFWKQGDDSRFELLKRYYTEKTMEDMLHNSDDYQFQDWDKCLNDVSSARRAISRFGHSDK
ncbi:hypothetical protein DFH28DRAFT_980373 [Melampsora americana]|nr:hypothetical protein DFH28DRAFT_980373 [Melampsora americana]